jgi:hypothetical protein
LPTVDEVTVGKGDGVDGVNHGLPLPTAILCQLPGSRQSHGFANCLAVGKARQSANPVLPTAGNSSGQRDLFAECREKQLAKKIAVGKEPVSCSEWGKTYAPLDLIASYYWHLEFKLRAQDCVKHAVSFSDVPH